MSKPVPFETTLHVRDHCLCLHAQQAARALSRRFDAAFRPLGISSGQFSLLMSLNRPEPATIGQVAETLAMDRTTLTANLKPLERKALIAVTPDARDKRGRRIALTEAGMALLNQAAPIWQTVHAEMEARLGEGEPDRLRAGLRELG
ncbi:MAG: MarR family transcriptional regulator [Sphingomonadales bacterium]|nr:MAG: MarR family transcriptional regulator [Sphingomonadales bacterium]